MNMVKPRIWKIFLEVIENISYDYGPKPCSINMNFERFWLWLSSKRT